MLESGSLAVRSSFFARTRSPSLPDRPMARPPASLTQVTISLLILPESTISTMSMVSASVTRRPSMKVLLIFIRSSRRPICGPPPCTTIGLMPTRFKSTTSRANCIARSGSPIAWPPYFTTKVLPEYLRM